MSRVAVGVDMAKATFTAAVWQAGRSTELGRWPNTVAGFAALEQAVEARAPAAAIQLILEPTGGYEAALAPWAHAQGWTVSQPNPRHVREWAAGLGRRAKTDRQDAQVLARYGAERQPPRWQPLATEVRELESLLRRKDELEAMLRQERNRQQALGLRPGVARAVPARVQRLIGALEGELREVEQAIAAHQRQQTRLQEQARQLRTVPGVGERTVLPLLVLLQRWDTLTAGRGDAKGLVAYAGLDPQPYESGTSVHRRATISRMGDRAMRRRLFMSALGGVRHANALRAFYLRLVGRGKAKKLALVAAARKLLVWAWAVFRRGTAFDSTRLVGAA
jgi:transposase